MPAIILPDKWRRQPSGPVSLDPRWSKNLLWCATPGSGGVDLTTGRLSVPAARSVTGGLGGLGYSYVTSGGGDTPTVNFSSSLSTNYVTQFTLFTMRSAVAWSACIYLRNGWHGLTFGPDGLDVRNVWAGIDWGTPTGLTLKVGKLHAAVQIITPTQKIAVVDGLVVTESQTNVEQAATLPTGWFGGDPGTTDRTLNGLIYLSGIVRDSWSIPQAIEWTRSPWQIFRKQSRVLYFDLGSGGGATYDVSVSESLAVASAQTNTADQLGTIAESAALTSAQANTMVADVTATMALAVTSTQDNTIDTSQTVAEAIAIVSAQAQDGAITMTVSESIGIASTEAGIASMTAAVSEAVAAVSAQDGTASLAVAIGEAIAVVVDQWVAGATVEGVIAESIAAATTLSVTVDVAGVISEALAAQSAQSVISTETATVTMAVGIADAVISGLVTSLGVTEAVAITTSEGGSIITAEFRTPDGRTLRIRFDARTLSVLEDDRTLYVSKTMH